jgi:protein-disulfide isomerase
MRVSIRKSALLFAVVLVSGVAGVLFGQATWQAVVDLPGVDWNGLTGAKKQMALRVMQTEGCTCGCDMKIAECRVKDPSCGVSNKLSAKTVKLAGEGKDSATIKTELERMSVFDDPVKISIAGDPVKGSDKAKLTIVEFSDFQCPYCSKVVADVKEVTKQFPNDIKFVFKQFPLDSHSEAEMGAEAALAAQAQGKFWEMHDLLYAGFPNLDRKIVEGYAKQLKLDMTRFDAEMTSHKYQARVMAEEKEGEDAGVAGTPTFFFNGKKYNGNFDVATVVPLIKKELGK